ncbi:MAG: hypothetical protein H5U40_09350 [Polyangiaceae bacterium]|nr:hypothetical protein [Polyangiaceae bacterium]
MSEPSTPEPALQSVQPLDAQERIFRSHPELFEFEDASFEGYQYFASMVGGDRLQLTGRLIGRSSARRTFRLDMQQLDDGRWRVHGFYVNIELGAVIPAATAAPSAP